MMKCPEASMKLFRWSSLVSHDSACEESRHAHLVFSMAIAPRGQRWRILGSEVSLGSKPSKQAKALLQLANVGGDAKVMRMLRQEVRSGNRRSPGTTLTANTASSSFQRVEGSVDNRTLVVSLHVHVVDRGREQISIGTNTQPRPRARAHLKFIFSTHNTDNDFST